MTTNNNPAPDQPLSELEQDIAALMDKHNIASTGLIQQIAMTYSDRFSSTVDEVWEFAYANGAKLTVTLEYPDGVDSL